MNLKKNIIAHRGIFDNDTIPENSMKAFKKALQESVPIELDVQLTKDNILVVFHDDNLKRMTGKNKLVEDSTYQELQELNLLNTKEKIPTLKEVLDLIQGKVLLDIEIKNTKRIDETCSILEDHLKEYNNFIVKSFNPKIVRKIKKRNPTWKVGYLIHKKYKNKLLSILLPSKSIIEYSKADFLAIHKELYNTKKFQSLKEKYPLFLWTINKEDKYPEDCILICNDLKSTLK